MSAEKMDTRPLAARMRPETLDEFVGQAQLLAPGRPLRRMIEADAVPSMIFWGPRAWERRRWRTSSRTARTRIL